MSDFAVSRWRAIAEEIMAGTVIPFLGAGASSFARRQSCDGPPTGRDLLQMLAEEAQLTVSCGKACQRTLYDLSRVASYYQLVKFDRDVLDKRIRQVTGGAHCTPNPLHRLLADVCLGSPMLIITTNYDSLLEHAFDDAGTPYEVVATAADVLAYRDADGDPQSDNQGKIYHRLQGSFFEAIHPREIEPELESRSLIYKVHGSVPCGQDWEGGYLIAEEDYARFLGRMSYDFIYPKQIKNIIKQKRNAGGSGRRNRLVHSLLFLGYSLNDWNLRVLMDELGVGQGLPGEERHYAIMKSPDPVAERLLDKRSISVYQEDLGQFVAELKQTLDALRGNGEMDQVV